MFKLTRTLVILTLLLAASLSAVRAQEAEGVIETFEGEMTEDEFEFEFTFDAEEGQVIAALFAETDDAGTLLSPTLVLENPAGDTIADTTESFSFGDVSLFAEINSTGTYTLYISRYEEEDGDDVGEFTITVVAVPVLEAGSPLEGTLTSEGNPGYYVVDTGSPFGVSFVKGDGDMDFTLSVNTIDSQSGTLTELATAEGEGLTEVLLGVFEGDEPYIVRVGEPFFFFSFDETSTDYRVELVSYE
jgi:hypothetical protein